MTILFLFFLFFFSFLANQDDNTQLLFVTCRPFQRVRIGDEDEKFRNYSHPSIGWTELRTLDASINSYSLVSKEFADLYIDGEIVNAIIVSEEFARMVKINGYLLYSRLLSRAIILFPHTHFFSTGGRAIPVSSYFRTYFRSSHIGEHVGKAG